MTGQRKPPSALVPECPKKRLGERGHYVTAGAPEANGSAWWVWCVCSCSANWWAQVHPKNVDRLSGNAPADWPCLGARGRCRHDSCHPNRREK